MSTRLRLAGCCDTPTAPPPLPEADRERLTAVFRALGDATRLEMFRLLAAQEAPVCACDVGAGFELSQPTISHHLRTLREAGLVTAEKRGVWAWYAPDPRGLAWFKATVAALDEPGEQAATDREEGLLAKTG